MFLGKNEKLPDDRAEKGVFVMAPRQDGALVGDDLVTAGTTAIDAGVGDRLTGLPVLVESP
jgi:hypothetical protein